MSVPVCVLLYTEVGDAATEIDIAAKMLIGESMVLPVSES
jgi:hypothetical protein